MTDLLLRIGIQNALAATALAAVAWAVTRYWRHAPLAWCLWTLVLLKLITPPLVQIPWELPFDWAQANVAASTALPSTAARAGIDSSGVTDDHSPLDSEDGSDEVASVAAAGPQSPLVTSNADFSEGIPGVAALSNDRTASTQAKPWDSFGRSSILMVAWLAGTVALLLLAMVRTIRFVRAVSRECAESPALQHNVALLAQRAGVRRVPQVRVTSARISPLVLAWWPRPLLLVSTGLLDRLTPRARDTILLHELAHLRRRDHWRAWFDLVVVCLYWWCPTAWLARRQTQIAADESCDGWVLHWNAGDNRIYAEALLASLEFVTDGRSRTPQVACGLGTSQNLHRRFQMLLSNRATRGLSGRAKLITGAVLLPALLISPLFLNRNGAVAQNATQPPADAAAVTADPPDATDVAGEEPGEEPEDVSGTIVDENGQPAPGTEVRLYHTQFQPPSETLVQTTFTNDAGRYQFDFAEIPSDENAQREYAMRVVVIREGYATHVIGPYHRPVHLTDTMLNLIPPASLRGIITGPDGQPLAGATVWTPDLKEPLEGIHTARSDENGRFEIADLMPWNSTEALQSGLQSSEVSTVTTGAPTASLEWQGSSLLRISHPEFGRIIMPYPAVPWIVNARFYTPGIVEGRLVNAEDGRPLAGLRINAGGDNAYWNALTDNDGRFRLLLQPRGDRIFEISAHSDDHPNWRGASWRVMAVPDSRLELEERAVTLPDAP